MLRSPVLGRLRRSITAYPGIEREKGSCLRNKQKDQRESTNNHDINNNLVPLLLESSKWGLGHYFHSNILRLGFSKAS